MIWQKLKTKVWTHPGLSMNESSLEKSFLFSYLNGNDTKNNWSIFRFNLSVKLKKTFNFSNKVCTAIFFGSFLWYFHTVESTECYIATYASNKNCQNILTNACSIFCFLSCLHKFILQKLLAVFLEYVETYEFQ